MPFDNNTNTLMTRSNKCGNGNSMSIASQIELGVDCVNCEQDDKILIIIKLCNNLTMIEKIEYNGIETCNHDNDRKQHCTNILFVFFRCTGCVHK